ncbi:hypothetical protein [Desulfonema ishimotonii]|uniref:hypothetical protein n=1 Tax=Desulfonema ishimotonii TaxID=45657 RepID=UPI00140D78AC|nr:hypothetical protein [Desulfonema ishimotonii]
MSPTFTVAGLSPRIVITGGVQSIPVTSTSYPVAGSVTTALIEVSVSRSVKFKLTVVCGRLPAGQSAGKAVETHFIANFISVEGLPSPSSVSATAESGVILIEASTKSE